MPLRNILAWHQLQQQKKNEQEIGLKAVKEEKPFSVEAVYEFFLCAVREFEMAQQQYHDRQYGKFITSLQESANSLVKTILSAKGKSPVGNTDIIEAQLAEFSRDDELIRKVCGSVDLVHSLTPTGLNTKKDNSRFETTLRKYEEVLIVARRWLLNELHLRGRIKQKINEMLTSKQGRKRLTFLVLPLVLLITVPVVFFYYLEPEDTFEIDGQVFWKEKPGVPFTPENSKRFTVFPGDKSHVYSIVLDNPVNVYLLRLDPVNQTGLTDIEIDWIRLYGPQGELVRDLIFDTSMYWSCDNCIKKESTTHSYRMQPTSNDPYITSSVIKQGKVKKLTISLRAVAKKTFWEWLLGIDKNMEF